MKSWSLLILIILYSCAPNESDLGPNNSQMANPENITSVDDDRLEKEFSHINEKDFIRASPRSYQISDDRHKVSIKSYVLQEGISHDKRAIDELDNRDATDITIIAVNCYQGKWKEAQAYADKLYPLMKKRSDYWNQIGNCYLISGDKEKATIFYNNALIANPNYSPTINNQATLMLKRGRDSMALKGFQKANKLNPNAAIPKFNLAQLYLKYSFIDKALELLSTLLQDDTNDNEILVAYASALLAKGNIELSYKFFKEIDKKFLLSTSHGINLAYVTYLAGDKNRAIDILDDLSANVLKENNSYFNKIKKTITR